MWLREFEASQDTITAVIEYFRDGFDAEDKLENLRRFFSHYYSPVIKAYGLAEAGGRFIEAMKSEKLRNAIWNENMPETFKKKEEIITQDCESKECEISSPNDAPLKYCGFVEVMKQNGLCPEDWYDGYRAFADKRSQLLQSYLAGRSGQ